MNESFAKLMEEFRQRIGMSRHRLAVEAAVDPSYLVRISSGDRVPPRVHIVESMARVLRLSASDRNRLLTSAGYAPAEVTSIGWSSALQAVADVLTDVNLTPEERDAYTNVIQQISARWRGGVAVTPRLTNGAEAHHV